VIAFNKKDYLTAENRLKKAKTAAEDKVADINWQLALVYSKQERWADAAKELKTYLKNFPEATNAAQVKGLIADFETKAGKKTE